MKMRPPKLDMRSTNDGLCVPVTHGIFPTLLHILTSGVKCVPLFSFT